MKKWMIGLVSLSTLFLLAGCQKNKTTKTAATSTSTSTSMFVQEMTFDVNDSSSTTETTTTETTTSEAATEDTLDMNSKDPNLQTMSSESSATVTTPSSTPAVTTGPWNAQKSQELASFMSNWGQTMKQSYSAYSPGKNVDFYGAQLPDDVLNKKNGLQAALNQQPIELTWSDNGSVPTGYAVVATYSDADTQPDQAKHFYFFTIKDGQPHVLITMQNQGNANNYLNMSETQNQDLANGFAAIVKKN